MKSRPFFFLETHEKILEDYRLREVKTYFLRDVRRGGPDLILVPGPGLGSQWPWEEFNKMQIKSPK